MSNKIMVLAHCEVSKNFVLNSLLLNKNVSFEDPGFTSWRHEFNLDQLKFLSKPVQPGKFTVVNCGYPRLINKLSKKIFSGWKFIYVESNFFNTLISHRIREKKKIGHKIQVDFVIQFELFYQKIKDQCIRIKLNDLFFQPEETISKIFKFVNIPLPKKAALYNYYHKDSTFQFWKDSKINMTNGFRDFIDHHEIIYVLEELAKHPKVNCLINREEILELEMTYLKGKHITNAKSLNNVIKQSEYEESKKIEEIIKFMKLMWKKDKNLINEAYG